MCPQAPAGWHPDPRGRHELRYWDGERWTDHVSDAGTVSSDPVTAILPPEPPEPDEPRSQQPAAPTREWAQPEARGEAPAPGSLWARLPEPAVAPGAREAGAGAAGRPWAEQAPAAERPAAEPVREPVPELAPGERSRELAALLNLLAPGTGHVYLGRGGAMPAFLIGATAFAVLLAYMSFGLFGIGLALWATAALYALNDERGGLAGLRAGRLPRGLAGWVLPAAGLALVVSLVLPYYHVAVDVQGFGAASGNASGFEAFGVLDLLLLALGLVAAVTGLAVAGALPAGPAQLPPWTGAALLGAGAGGLALIAYRMLDQPGDFSAGGLLGVDVDVGRGPGLLLAAAACIAIVACARSVATAPRAARPAPREDEAQGVDDAAAG